MTGQLPRGIRNNNPGNIREAKGDHTQWVGERAADDDPAFEEFNTPEDGIRALARVLLNYQKKHGLRTLEQIIRRWAPASENNTGAYVLAVSHACGIPSNVFLDLTIPAILTRLTRAIVRHENGPGPLTGGEWYDDAIYKSAIARALS